MAAVLQDLTGVTVDSPGDWDTPATSLPNIKLRALGDVKASNGRAMATFTTMAPLQLVARVRAGTAEAAQDAIEALGLPAVLPPPEEVKNVETAIGASRAEQQRESML